MLTLRESVKVFIYLEPSDMRKSINGLTSIVADEFETSAQSGNLFVFYNKKKDKLKLVYWDRNGFVLYYKRLDKGRFKFSKEKTVTLLRFLSNNCSGYWRAWIFN